VCSLLGQCQSFSVVAGALNPLWAAWAVHLKPTLVRPVPADAARGHRASVFFTRERPAFL
jgi:hypothetical protein